MVEIRKRAECEMCSRILFPLDRETSGFMGASSVGSRSVEGLLPGVMLYVAVFKF